MPKEEIKDKIETPKADNEIAIKILKKSSFCKDRRIAF